MVHIDAEIIGALLGAVFGAITGAITGLAVSRWSIRYDRQLAACSAMQALADEARFNAQVVRHLHEDASDFSPSALERQAFDEALPVLHVLPTVLRERSRDARSKILIMMHLEEILESAHPNAAGRQLRRFKSGRGCSRLFPESSSVSLMISTCSSKLIAGLGGPDCDSHHRNSCGVR